MGEISTKRRMDGVNVDLREKGAVRGDAKLGCMEKHGPYIVVGKGGEDRPVKSHGLPVSLTDFSNLSRLTAGRHNAHGYLWISRNVVIREYNFFCTRNRL